MICQRIDSRTVSNLSSIFDVILDTFEMILKGPQSARSIHIAPEAVPIALGRVSSAIETRPGAMGTASSAMGRASGTMASSPNCLKMHPKSHQHVVVVVSMDAGTWRSEALRVYPRLDCDLSFPNQATRSCRPEILPRCFHRLQSASEIQLS